MSIKKSPLKSIIYSEPKGWDKAINEAQKHIQKLTAAIRVFKKNKAEGVPWPEDSGYTVTQKQ